MISLLLTASGAIIYYCSYTSTALKTRYPMTACDETIKSFQSEMQEWQYSAEKEFKLNENLKDKNQRTQYTTILKCFCENAKASN